VGDAYFQHKSFDRIREFGKQGTTLLIVSHDKQAIQSVCDRAILLNAGHLVLEDKPESVMDYYNALLAGHQNQQIKQIKTEDERVETISGTGEARVAEISLFDETGRQIEVVEVGQSIILRVVVEAIADIERLVFGYSIKDRLGQVIFGTNTDLKQMPLIKVPAGSKFCIDVEFPANLGIGTYSIQTALHSTDTHLENNFEWRDLALIFNVINAKCDVFVGLAWIDPVIKIRRQ
jgi:lipopolysaccharide transport system ATP-binding protein